MRAYKTGDCCECLEENLIVSESRNGLTCKRCDDSFSASYDDYVDPLGAYH